MPVGFARNWAGSPAMTSWRRSCRRRWPGNAAGARLPLPSTGKAYRRHPGCDFRVRPDSGLQVAIARGVAALDQGKAAAIAGFHQVGRESQGGIIMHDGLLVLAELEIDEGHGIH